MDLTLDATATGAVAEIGAVAMARGVRSQRCPMRRFLSSHLSYPVAAKGAHPPFGRAMSGHGIPLFASQSLPLQPGVPPPRALPLSRCDSWTRYPSRTYHRATTPLLQGMDGNCRVLFHSATWKCEGDILTEEHACLEGLPPVSTKGGKVIGERAVLLLLLCCLGLASATITTGASDRSYLLSSYHAHESHRALQATVSDVAGLVSAIDDASISHIVIADGHYALDTGLSVTRSVTIQAARVGAVVLDGHANQISARTVLTVRLASSSDTVQLLGLNITGGYAPACGNVNCAAGGGITVDGGTVTISACQIHGNVAHQGGYGAGGVFVASGQVTLQSCEVYNHVADYAGGVSVTGGTVSLIKCNIFANHVSEGAAGVSIGAGHVSFQSCLIHGNTALFHAGISMYGSGTVTLNNSKIYGNVASNDAGGINIKGPTVVIDSCEVFDNRAGGHGGGVIINGGGQATFHSCQIHNNTADISGGGISNTGGTVHFVSTDILENQALQSGGGAYLSASTSTFYGGLVSGNTAPNGGGVFTVAPVVCQIVGLAPPSSIIFGNTPTDYNNAGAFTHLAAPSPPPPLPPPPSPPPPAHPSHIYSNATLETAVEWLLSSGAKGLIVRLLLTPGQFVLTSTVDLSISLASMIYLTGTSDTTITVLPSSVCAFKTGTATFLIVDGVAFHSTLCLYGGQATLRDVSFLNINTQASSALIVQDEADVKVHRSVFKANRVYSSGGAITLRSGKLTLIDCQLSENVAGMDGGGIMMWGGHLEAIGTLLERNQAARYGGALMVASGSVLLANETLLFSNSALGAAPSSVFVANGTVIYRLPAPLGRWILTDGHTTTALLPQDSTSSDFPYPCAPGIIGRTLDVSAQSGPQCSGLCPPGHFCPANTSQPRLCPKGHFCAEASPAASPCTAGTWSNVTGLKAEHECNACPAGHACALASTAPMACVPGSFGAQPKQATCELCRGGKYASTAGKTACEECIPGYLCVEGSSAPQPCPAGTHANASLAYLSSLDECITCPAGTSCSVGSPVPTLCLPGSFASHAKQATCEPCPGGKYTLTSGNTACKICVRGSFCPNGTANPVACPDGTAGDLTGLESALQCSPCPAGYWCNSGRTFPCDVGFYSLHAAPSMLSKDLSTCRRCPLHSTTEQHASSSVDRCVCETSYYLTGTACLPCPAGALCTQPGLTLRSLPVEATYWKPGYRSNVTKPCPRASTCAHGTVSDAHYNHTSASTCAPGRGVAGVYCLLCAQTGYYFDDDAERCKPCSEEVSRVLLFLTGVVVVISAIAAVVHYRVGARMGFLAAWHRLLIAVRRVSLVTKLKICISYYQILTQLNRVYAIVYPPEYAKLVGFLDSVFFRVFFGWIPGVATACTGLDLAHELILICIAPCAVIFAVTAVIVARSLPLASVLVWSLVVSFLCFPFVASRGFRALAPCDCFDYVDGGAACFLRDAYSVTCVMDASSGAYSAPVSVRAAAWLAISMYAVTVPCIYAGLLFYARPSLLGRAPPTALSRRLQFLTKGYQPRVFYWELVEVMRKIVITGFLALVRPGSLLQLYLGVTVALCILILQLHATPYATASDNFLSFVSASALVFTLLASLGIQLTELTPDLSALGVALTGLGGHPLPLIAAVLIVAGLCVLVVICVMFVQELRTLRRLPFAHTVREGKVAQPRFLADDNYHAFISHQWSHSQDQAHTIKADLTALVPSLRVFLDIHDLTDIGALETLIDSTDTVIIFLAGSVDGAEERSDYMRSANCLREFRRAVEAKKSIVFVCEMDPQHGAISMAAHRLDCPDDLRHVLDNSLVVPWYRVKAYAQVSLRQIAEVILKEDLFLPGELLRCPLRLAPLTEGEAHLYAPSGTPDALIGLLKSEAPGLIVTTEQAERGLAQRFLLYLNDATWACPDSQKLQVEVEAALAVAMPLLMVHEQRDGYGSVPFGTIIAQTPRRLVEAYGLYKSALAIPLYDGNEFQRVCLRVMIGDAPSKLRRQFRWPRHPWQKCRELRWEQTPALLELTTASTKV